MVDKASHGGVSCRHGSPAEVVETVLLRAAKPLPARTKGSTARFRGDARAGNPGLPEASREKIKHARMYVQVREQAVNRVKICSLKRGETSRITCTIFTSVSGDIGGRGRGVLRKVEDWYDLRLIRTEGKEWSFGFTSADWFRDFVAPSFF